MIAVLLLENTEWIRSDLASWNSYSWNEHDKNLSRNRKDKNFPGEGSDKRQDKECKEVAFIPRIQRTWKGIYWEQLLGSLWGKYFCCEIKGGSVGL